MIPYDWETDPRNWLEQRPEYSCLPLLYSIIDGDRSYGERQRPKLRLVTIDAGGLRDSLRCSLVVIPLDANESEDVHSRDQQEYEAISYVWGSTDDLVPIRCKSDSSQMEFSYSWILITRNCAEVFRRLRRMDKPRQVWIDAISIDQEDMQDRAHYVRQMHSIYREASRVVVVLPNFQTSSGTHWAQSKPGSWIFSHPYFSRIWILQEVYWGQNPVVYAGDVEIRWSELCDLYTAGLAQNAIGSQAVQTTVGTALELGRATPNIRSTRKRRRPLLQLYQMSASFQATDPRDKLIALISMATDIEPQIEAILVDYTITTEELLRRFAAILCFRALNIMPGILNGFKASDRHSPSHKAWPACMAKIDNFISLTRNDLQNLKDTFNFRMADLYSRDINTHKVSERRLVSDSIFREQPHWKTPVRILFAVPHLTIVSCFGNEQHKSRRKFPGSQSPSITVLDLLEVIDKAKALVFHPQAANNEMMMMKDSGALPLRIRRSEESKNNPAVKVAILGNEPFDLCLVPGHVNALRYGSMRILVESKFPDDDAKKPPVPLLVRFNTGPYKVLGLFYELDYTPAEHNPDMKCCHVPLVDYTKDDKD